MKKLFLFFAAILVAASMWGTDIVWKWTSADASLSCSDGSYHSFTSVDGNYTLTFRAGGNKDKVDATSNTIDDVEYTHQLYMNGATNSSKRYVSFTGISGNGYLTLVTGTNAGGKPVLSKASNTTASNVIATIQTETGGVVTAKGSFTSGLIEDLDATKTYYICFPTKCYLYAVIWTPYSGALTASMTVSPSEIKDIPSDGGNYTVNYEIKNPVQGASVSASADVTWIRSVDYSVDGKVSFTVDANTGAARQGLVTLSYNDGAVEKKVSVSQKRYIDRSIVYSWGQINMAAYQNEATTIWDIDADWSSSDKSSTTAYYKLFSSNTLNSPKVPFDKAASVKITVNMRTVGGVSGNSAKLDIKCGGETLTTLTATNNNLNDYEVTLTELPAGDNYFVFESQSADDSHGLGVRNISFELLGEKVSVSSVGYATYYNAEHAVELPAGVTGYTWYDGLNEVYGEGYAVIPAGEPVVLKAAAKTYSLNYTTTDNPSMKSYGQNSLCGAASNMTASEMETENAGANYFYALSLNSAGAASSVGFYWINERGAAFDITAGKAYLVLPPSTDAPAHFLFIEEEGITTDVENTLVDKQTAKFIENGQLIILKDGVRYNAVGQVIR